MHVLGRHRDEMADAMIEALFPPHHVGLGLWTPASMSSMSLGRYQSHSAFPYRPRQQRISGDAPLGVRRWDGLHVSVATCHTVSPLAQGDSLALRPACTTTMTHHCFGVMQHHNEARLGMPITLAQDVQKLHTAVTGRFSAGPSRATRGYPYGIRAARGAITSREAAYRFASHLRVRPVARAGDVQTSGAS